MKARRHVHFDMNQENQTTQQASDNLVNRDKLPSIISIAEEMTEARPSTSRETLVGEYEQDQRLPPLTMTPSPRIITEIINDDPQQRRDDTPQSSERVSPTGPSWVERQVAKVRQRKLWAFRQQQQQKLNHHHHPPRAILKRSVSLLVNVPDESDTETDSLNEEEEEDQDDRSEDSVTASQTRQSLAWDVMMDKDELAEMSNKEQIKEETSVDSSYSGWPHFPAKLAICIQQRQKSLRERKAGRKDSQETRNDGKLNHHHNSNSNNNNSNNNNNNNGNSFERRKRFGKKLSIAVVRQQRKGRIPNRVLSSIHQPQAIQSTSDPIQQHKNENENDPAVLQNADDDVGQCLTNAISSLQVLDSSSHPVRNADEFSETSSTAVESNEIHTTTPSPSVSPSDDQISEVDMIQPVEDASVSPSESSDAETIVADARYHLDELIPAADDDPMTSKEIDDEDDYPQNAGSTFCHPVSHVCQRHPDESISDVTVDDGPYSIDQSELNVMTIPQQQNDGIAIARLDVIPAEAGISSVVEQTEYHISLPIQHRSAIDNKDNVLRTRLSAYCSGWPIGVISNQNGEAIPSHPPHFMSTNVSYLWDDNFEAPTSEETMMGTINHPEVDISSEATAFAIPGTQKDSNHPPPLPVSPEIIQTSLIDKKTKEARNASRILFPTVPMSIATEKERPQLSGQTSKDQHHKMEEDKNVSDSMEEEMVDDCQCLHRAVLTCLLPDAAETLDNLELIRRQLKKARIRRHQGSEQQRQQPMQVRRDILSAIDPNVSSSN